MSRTTDDSSAPRGSRRVWRQLADRRVPHLVVAYVAVSWGLIQAAVAIVVARFGGKPLGGARVAQAQASERLRALRS